MLQGAPNQKWKAESAGDGLYYITGAQSPETYLSIDGAPENGRPVIHSGEKMKWAAKHDSGGIRCVHFSLHCYTEELMHYGGSIYVPGTQYDIELGTIGDLNGDKVHKVRSSPCLSSNRWIDCPDIQVYLWEKSLDRKQIWKVLCASQFIANGHRKLVTLSPAELPAKK